MAHQHNDIHHHHSHEDCGHDHNHGENGMHIHPVVKNMRVAFLLNLSFSIIEVWQFLG